MFLVASGQCDPQTFAHRLHDTRSLSVQTKSRQDGLGRPWTPWLDEPRPASLDEMAGGRGDVLERRRLLDDPSRQIAAARGFVLRVAGLAVQPDHLQRILEQHALELTQGEFSEEGL